MRIPPSAYALLGLALMDHARTTSEPVGRAGARRAAAYLMLLMFFLSGVAALVYQIVWARKLFLVFGVTVYATSAVVTTFMAGLALGSLYFGRVADRWRRPLVLFAMLELGIGAFGALFPLIAEALEPVYVAFYGPFGQNHYVMSLVRFGLSFAVLLVPTSLMGGTLPVLSRAYVSHAKRLGKEVAGLYSVNNLGAFIGCVLAGYAFIELLGVNGTHALAASLNVAVALAALALDRRLGPRATREEALPGPAAVDAPALPGAAKVALWVFGIEGFTSLVYQMAWMRMLIFFLQTNIYAITAIVATFLAGLSLGAFAVKRWVDRTLDPYRLLGLIELGIAVTALITIPLLPWMMRFHAGFRQSLLRWHWAGSTLGSFAVTCLVILPPTAFMGATMPVVSRIYVPALAKLGRKMGVIGCLDTLGSIFGAFAGGFILIPLLGIQRTIIATALINLGLAAWVFRVDPVRRLRRSVRVGLAVSAAALVPVALLLVLRPVPLVDASQVLQGIEQRQLLDYHEGVESTVSVVDFYEHTRVLLVNQSSVAQTGRLERPSHELIAHYPVLLHPHPKRALLVGFGIGFTAWACRVHDLDVDVVELSGGGIEAKRFFKHVNNDILSDEHVRLYVDDGRNYVLGTQRKYDFIQAGIIHPGVSSGNAGFYTTDFYRECKRILAPGGVMCQWLPLHAMPHEAFKTLIRSFQAEFPYASVWYKCVPGHCVLVGTEEPLRIDFQDVRARVNRPAVRAHLARCDVQDVYDLLDAFCCADEKLAAIVGPGPLHTDDRPLVEFACGRPRSPADYPRNVRFLHAARQFVWPRLVNVPPEESAQVRERLARWFRATGELQAAEYYWVALDVLPLSADVYARTFRQMQAAFGRCLALNPDDRNAEFIRQTALSATHLATGRRSLAAGRRAEALENLRRAMESEPEGPYAAQARFFYRQAVAAAP